MGIAADEATGRFMVLWQVVDYLCDGPYDIRVGDGPSMELVLSMRQFRYIEGWLENRAVHVRGDLGTGSTGLVRQLVWRRLEDRERCKSGVVSWPNVEVLCFQVDSGELRSLDALTREFQQALIEARFEASGIGINLSSEGGESAERIPRAPPQGTPPPYRRRISVALAPASVELTYVEGGVPELDTRWSPVWDMLGRLCQPGASLPEVRESYWIPPQQYGALLASSMAT